MPVSSRVIANAVIAAAAETERVRTPLEILKLVYISHGFHLGFWGELFTGEQVEAWRYGPVLPTLYGAMKAYGSKPVVDYLRLPFFAEGPRTLTADQTELVRWVQHRYRDYSGLQLSAMTHAAGTPWSITMTTQGQNAIIAPELIQEHYGAIIDELPRAA